MMPATNILPPNPSLVAILLVIKSLSGPRLVFHYPPHPAGSLSNQPTHPQWYGTTASNNTDDESTSSSSSGWSSDSDTSDNSSAAEDGDPGSRAGSRADSRGTSRGGPREGRSRGQRSMRSASEDLTEDEDEDDGLTGTGDEDGKSGQGGSGRRGASVSADGAPEWDSLMGFKSEGLEKLLCPGRGFNKRKFEAGMEGLSFIGYPTFAKEKGGWRKRGMMKKRKTSEEVAVDGVQINDNQKATVEHEDEGLDMADEGRGSGLDEMPAGFEPGYGHELSDEGSDGALSDAASDAKSASTAGGEEDMTMFNVVFVLNPPALEYQLRTEEMYDNVIRKFSRDLKYEQAKTGYVSRQSKVILDIKNKAKENRESIPNLWSSIIHVSPLAKSIAILFDSISNSRIAHIHFGMLADASYQIPQPPSLHYLPRPTDPQMPGLWLTTANLPDGDRIDSGPQLPLTPHSALLFLEDKETILKEIESDAKEYSAQIAYYISNLNPTKSLHKTALAHKIPLADLEFIAAHLIYWRRARAIPPLHQRDTYIVSPNADMRKLPQAIPTYASRFPTLPSLPKMLSLLSNQSPRTYGSLIPSKDHRSAYMDILAWLMRGGWVTQLRTFAWIRVSAEVQADVAAIMEREAKEAARAAMAAARERHAALDHQDDASDRATIASEDAPSTPQHRRSPRNSDSESNRSTKTTGTSMGVTLNTNTSPTALRHSPLQASHSAASLTALSDFSHPHGTPSTPQRNGVLRPGFQPHPHHAHQQHQHASKDPVDYTPRMIYSPQKANSLEARWIDHIRRGFDDEEVRQLFPVLQKYFDGAHALDDIAGREGVKRKRVWGVLNALREKNVLYVVRYW
ncbi:nitrogen permease regulator of amino acid transport activity 3-domain-containing protein [Phyllosticta citriasiana]|uniref:nitrogen permease regulator of amino acid transport activity 3-domain-containing protein n=1 Tax=Phyllosticta citriasiana TaxID=595635 RepID=UPI0030FD60A8